MHRKRHRSGARKSLVFLETLFSASPDELGRMIIVIRAEREARQARKNLPGGSEVVIKEAIADPEIARMLELLEQKRRKPHTIQCTGTKGKPRREILEAARIKREAAEARRQERQRKRQQREAEKREAAEARKRERDAIKAQREAEKRERQEQRKAANASNQKKIHIYTYTQLDKAQNRGYSMGVTAGTVTGL